MTIQTRIGCALLLGALTVTPALAADPVRPDGGGDWSFTTSLYLWGTGLEGDIAQFGLPAVHVDSSFSDILDDLDFALMAMGEARKDRFSVFGDLMYTKISPGSATPRGILADSVELTSETTAALLGAGYAVIQTERGHLDVVAAARLWHASTDIAFTGGVLDGVSRRDSDQWVDALAGVRGRYMLNDKFHLAGWGLVGAGQADLDWEVAVVIGYEFSDRFAAMAGYRALGVDYEEDGFEFDVAQQGPLLGAVFRF